MEKKEIADGIRKLGPWFHKIELPGGQTTKRKSLFGEPMHHPHKTWRFLRKVIPQDLTGKRVLDIGCNGGFYSIEANKRGADVVGVDAKRLHLRQATFASRALGLEGIQFKRRSLYELNPEEDGTYDVVLALGLIYHLKHLISGLEILYDLCRDLLIIETEVLVEDRSLLRRKKKPLTDTLRLDYQRNNPESDEAAYNWFIPAPETVKAMLEDIGFVEVEIVKCFGARAILVARKGNRICDSRHPAYLKAHLETDQELIRCCPGETIPLQVTARNTGRGKWLCHESTEDEKGAVGVFLYLTSADDPVFGTELPRHPLPDDIPPGESVSCEIQFTAPDSPGSYDLEVDLLAEHVTLFQDTGSSPVSLRVEVMRDTRD